MNKIENRLCEYRFSEQEKREIAQELANSVSEMKTLEDKLKAVNSQIKAEISSKQGIVNLKAENLRSGFEMRSVECEKVMAYIDNEVRWVRCDTGEIAHRRRMDADERQRSLEEVES